MSEKIIGVLGGSGLYSIEGLKIIEEKKICTPFGEPSDLFVIGELSGVKIAFLPRHGKGHRFLPHQINYRANIYGFKMLGVEYIIAVSAVGSMREQLRPLDIVVVDQFFDLTRSRINTFFGDGVAAHISFADPVCPVLSKILYDASVQSSCITHKGGTYLCIEGPAFSTKAESQIYRKWGVDVIGMTNLPEAKLAREAEICYATLALVTDYDVWHEQEEGVSAEMILSNLKKNVDNAKEIIKKAVLSLPEKRECPCPNALQNAIITPPELIPEKRKKELELIIGKYL